MGQLKSGLVRQNEIWTWNSHPSDTDVSIWDLDGTVGVFANSYNLQTCSNVARGHVTRGKGRGRTGALHAVRDKLLVNCKKILCIAGGVGI